jgi:hypothetical protein
MKNFACILSMALTFTACAHKPKSNSAMLEKYPACYHKNEKLAKRCIERNEAGESVTALELENTAYPGQYK